MFDADLEIDVTLTVDGTAHAIVGGNVRLLELTLCSYGFKGAVEFVMADDEAHGGEEQDELLPDFQKSALMDVSVSVAAVFPEPEATGTPDPLKVTGIATHRSVEENDDPHHQDRAITWRRYRVEFADPARVLWGQHHPCALYTQTTMTKVVDDHIGEKITITYDGDAWSAARPLVFLNLVPEERATFYDFVLWYTDTYAQVLSYDYTAAGYTLRAAKDASGTVAQLFGGHVERLRVVFPEPPRHAANVLNSYATAETSTAVANANAEDKIRHDFLVRSAIAQDATDRVTTETSRLVTRLAELRVELAVWPTIAFQPGALIGFTAANLWPASSLQMALKWRVRRHEIRARAMDQGPDATHDEPSAMFQIEASADLEQQGEVWVDRPPFARPTWPAYLEGNVVSTDGADDELTYQYATDEDTSLNTYTVKVPLFAGQTVTAPYDPHEGAGKMYVPIFKNARVLVAMGLFDATVVRVLAWRDSAPLDMAAQGERLFFGKKSAAGTMVDHKYDDTKPVFAIARTNAKDTGTITISEGSLVIQVKENT